MLRSYLELLIGVKPGSDWGFADKFDFSLLHTERQDWKL